MIDAAVIGATLAVLMTLARIIEQLVTRGGAKVIGTTSGNGVQACPAIPVLEAARDDNSATLREFREFLARLERLLERQEERRHQEATALARILDRLERLDAHDMRMRTPTPAPGE